MDRTNRREMYYPPECIIFSFTQEKSILSGFDTEDWKKDPDELG